MAFRELVITTGDRDGVGLEVALKALKRRRPSRHFRAILILDKRDLGLLRRFGFDSKKIPSVAQFADLASLGQQGGLWLMPRTDSAAHWVKAAAEYCLKTPDSALVTGPLSKTLVQKSGIKAMGHTGILKLVTKNKNLFMGFVGRHFSVVLSTDHIALNQVPRALTTSHLHRSLAAAFALRKILPKKKHKLPVGVLGLNPHSGEEGLLGTEEIRLVSPTLRKYNMSRVVGPLVPDAAFKKENQRKFSVFLALYHDQGLIPFKMIHGGAGAHITLGLPFIRTSVDHGTAKDIFGRRVADPTSMISAIDLALRLRLPPTDRRSRK